MPIRAVLFDHDGTLVDSYAGIACCMQLTCQDLDKPPMSDNEVLASIGPTLENRFTELWGEKVSEEACRIYRTHYESHFLTGTELISGVLETLEAVEKRGLAIACVTNKSRNYCLRQLEHFGLLSKMQVVYANQQGIPPKPDPAMVFAALDHLDIPPEEAVLVGDTPIDIAAAKAAGVGAWAVRSRYTPKEDLEKSGPDRIFNALPEILENL